MVLGDRSVKEEIVRGRVVLDPLDMDFIQPASVDVHLDKRLLVSRTGGILLTLT